MSEKMMRNRNGKSFLSYVIQKHICTDPLKYSRISRPFFAHNFFALYCVSFRGLFRTVASGSVLVYRLLTHRVGTEKNGLKSTQYNYIINVIKKNFGLNAKKLPKFKKSVKNSKILFKFF